MKILHINKRGESQGISALKFASVLPSALLAQGSGHQKAKAKMLFYPFSVHLAVPSVKLLVQYKPFNFPGLASLRAKKG
jgi:hypothetical protein